MPLAKIMFPKRPSRIAVGKNLENLSSSNESEELLFKVDDPSPELAELENDLGAKIE